MVMNVPRHPDPTAGSVAREDGYLWEQPAILPEDHAMGLELELIELEHEREVAEADRGPTAHTEAQIDEVLASLAESGVSEPDREPHVEVDAPRAADAAADG